VRVNHAQALERWEALDGRVPNQPKLTWLPLEPDEDGMTHLEISSPHASEEAVARAVGLTVYPDVAAGIRRTTPSTAGYVVSEPHRPPAPSAAAATVKRTQPVNAPVRANEA
jgi:hypothetical protein